MLTCVPSRSASRTGSPNIQLLESATEEGGRIWMRVGSITASRINSPILGSRTHSPIAAAASARGGSCGRKEAGGPDSPLRHASHATAHSPPRSRRSSRPVSRDSSWEEGDAVVRSPSGTLRLCRSSRPVSRESSWEELEEEKFKVVTKVVTKVAAPTGPLLSDTTGPLLSDTRRHNLQQHVPVTKDTGGHASR